MRSAGRVHLDGRSAVRRWGADADRGGPDSGAAVPVRRVEVGGRGVRWKTWSLSSGIPHAVCRLGNVYGPRQSPHGEAGVVAIFAHHLHTGRAPKLYGHGRPTRDYVYVGDVVGALLSASGRSGTYNIATGVETDVAAVWNELSSAAGKRIEPELADLRAGELTHSCLDIGRAERELGWRPEVPIAQGLRLTYEALVEEFEQR